MTKKSNKHDRGRTAPDHFDRGGKPPKSLSHAFRCGARSSRPVLASHEMSSMKPKSKRTRRLAKLGVTDFETVAATQKRQNDMLKLLGRALPNPGRLAGFADCNKGSCGKIRCAEVCQFGNRRRRRKEIPAVHRLFHKSQGSFYEVRVGRGVWAQPAGKLNQASIAAAKKLNRLVLDKLYMPGVVAVGMFKAWAASEHEGGGWKCEIHQIISGAKEEELDKVFATSRKNVGNFLSVKEVTNLGQAISGVLKREVQGWQHPYRTELTPDRPQRRQRAEYYEWLLNMSAGERVVRYGCDRYFNRLKKKPRLVRIKVPKKRPYPHHLHPYMYGTHNQNCKCDRCMGSNPLN